MFLEDDAHFDGGVLLLKNPPAAPMEEPFAWLRQMFCYRRSADSGARIEAEAAQMQRGDTETTRLGWKRRRESPGNKDPSTG